MNVVSTGYFREMPDGNSTNPSIMERINKNKSCSIEKICKYLDSGIPIIISPGTVLDIIDESKGVAGTPSVFTDGKWAWSGALSYYVKNYNLLLDGDFLKTMETNNWQIPIQEKDLDYSNIKLDGKTI